MIAIILMSFVATVAAQAARYEVQSAAGVSSTSNTYTYYYLCGSGNNQYLSTTPCNNGNQCGYVCMTTSWCQGFNRNWQCKSSCCQTVYNPPITTPSPTPSPQQPTCGGRETSAGFCNRYQCPSGFSCTVNGVCCRCEYGTSIGPCVNGQCPQNTRCNVNNECCPFQVGGGAYPTGKR